MHPDGLALLGRFVAMFSSELPLQMASFVAFVQSRKPAEPVEIGKCSSSEHKSGKTLDKQTPKSRIMILSMSAV